MCGMTPLPSFRCRGRTPPEGTADPSGEGPFEMLAPPRSTDRGKTLEANSSRVYWPTRLAQVVLAADSAGTSVHDALIDRAVPAALNLIPRTRLASQPNYISDIGLRPLSDPWELLQLHSFDTIEA